MEELEKFFEENKSVFISLMVLTILPIVTASYLLYELSSLEETLRHPVLLTVILMVVIGAFTMALGVVPTSIAGLACGYIFGFESLPLFIFTYGFAASLGYFVFQMFDKGHFIDKLRQMPQVEVFWQRKDRFNWALVFFTRLTPVMPFAVTNVVLAACKFKYPVYLIGSIAGMLPRAALFFWFGSEAHNLTEAIKGQEDYTRMIFTAIFTITGLGALSLIGKKIWKE